MTRKRKAPPSRRALERSVLQAVAALEALLLDWPPIARDRPFVERIQRLCALSRRMLEAFRAKAPSGLVTDVFAPLADDEIAMCVEMRDEVRKLVGIVELTRSQSECLS